MAIGDGSTFRIMAWPWWALWATLASLPWLVPTHAQPWTAFHVDAAMIVPAVLLLAYALLSGPARFPIPPETWILLAVAAVPIGQLLFGLIDFAGDAWLAALYVLSLACATTVGARMQQLQPWRLPNALLASFAIAGLVSVLLMVLQWLRLDILGTLLLSLPTGARLSANLGQPNQLATLLVWGLIAVWWAHLLNGLHGGIAACLAALLLAGIAMTQSRAGALEVVLIACAAWRFRRDLRTSRYVSALVGLGIGFALAFVAWPLFSETLRPGQVQTLGERMASGTRLQHWTLLLDAVAARPWFGWGWNQVVHAQWDLALLHPPTHEVVQYAHNLVLDLLLWNGLPIGALLTIGLLVWFWRQYRMAASPERVLLLLAIAAFVLHALFEFPHGYFVFLFPVGLMAGSLYKPTKLGKSLVLDRGAVTLVLVGMVLMALAILQDYMRVSSAWMAERFRVARIGTPVEVPLPRSTILSNMDALLVSLRTRPTGDMSAQELEQLEITTRRFPSVGGLFRYAWALALNGRQAEATRTLEFLCHVHVEEQCLAARQAWVTKAEQEYPTAKGVWPADRPPRRGAQPD